MDTPRRAVVVSGWTRGYADEVERTAPPGSTVVVHEACRRTALADAVAGTVFETIFSYHADTVELGGMAERAAIKHLVLTHLIPAPAAAEDEAWHSRTDVRPVATPGGVTVGRDLAVVTLGPTDPSVRAGRKHSAHGPRPSGADATASGGSREASGSVNRNSRLRVVPWAYRDPVHALVTLQ